jgi:protein-disulfide isomerase
MSKLTIAVNEKDHTLGDATAKCVLVEYGDYECPHCGAAHPVVKKLEKHFGKRMLFVFRNFPLSQMHPWAETAAETAEFAGANGKFWEMHDLLFENQASFGGGMFVELTDTLGLSSAQLKTALAEQKYQAHVQEDFLGGVRSGVNGTPTFFINGMRYNGAYDFESLSYAIEAAM